MARNLLYMPEGMPPTVLVSTVCRAHINFVVESSKIAAGKHLRQYAIVQRKHFNNCMPFSMSSSTLQTLQRCCGQTYFAKISSWSTGVAGDPVVLNKVFRMHFLWKRWPQTLLHETIDFCLSWPYSLHM